MLKKLSLKNANFAAPSAQHPRFSFVITTEKIATPSAPHFLSIFFKFRKVLKTRNLQILKFMHFLLLKKTSDCRDLIVGRSVLPELKFLKNLDLFGTFILSPPKNIMN